ncbi:DUF2844 domain-containing protein [Trinickia terrae]|uniref:DUF2844 domain-containing protein n=1 Tax=Trinickia terrae TaxID=2571161 RepID=A0A4U1HPG7_9BURK|nr:DUF2844 domain-containing protein [Trinickia terrae]TKC81697.1 DUF2844 domain-containing protein [Trinickia terrae]
MRSVTPTLAARLAALVVSAATCAANAQLGGARAPSAGLSTNGALTAHALAQPTGVDSVLNVTTSVDDGGTTIREYTTQAGQIVAYTWSGPTMPDLHTLLGARFEAFQTGAASSPSRHAGHVARGDFIVESGGQMRGYIGRAWLPNALPAGVSIDDLR